MLKLILLCLGISFVFFACNDRQQNAAFSPGEIWSDTDGVPINAHAGGILNYDNNYYWFGEYKTSGKEGNVSQYGVSCYVSEDLMNWDNKGIVFKVDTSANSEITKGCIIERPKVVFNKKTKKFVMWFHLELKGEGYTSARTGVAVSDDVEGPYEFLKSFRPNAGSWPINFTEKQRTASYVKDYTWWTDEFFKLVVDGLFVSQHFNTGQMSRDMTLFVDADGKAYHIHSSEENLTLHISELTDDYLGFTGKWKRFLPAQHNEAPTIFKRKGKYFMISSGCTGWDPNAARLYSADSVMGKWTYMGNPCVGDNSDKTFYSQGTFILQPSDDDDFIFMADRWRPRNPIDGRYVWLPIKFKSDIPYIEWHQQWDLTVFNMQND